MLTVTSAERALIEAGRIPDFRAVITYAGGTSETLGASRFLSGSPVIKLGVSADGVFTVGGAVIGSFNFSLINDDGHFDSTDFAGAQIVPQVGFPISGSTTWHSLGTYHLSSHKNAGSVIMCTAYDSLALLDDAEFTASWPVTFLAAAQAICTRHGLTLASNSFTGASMSFAEPEEAMTDRMVLAYMAQCTGNHVRMNAAGQMVIARPTGVSAKTVSSVFNANLQTSEIAYTGVMITPYGGDTPSLYGSAGNILTISDNPLITDSNVDDVGAMLWGTGGYITAVNTNAYTAGDADILSDFTIEPGDAVTINSKKFLVTNLTYKLGVQESVSCDAEDRVSNDLRKSNTEIFAAGIASSKETAMSAETAAAVANSAANNALIQLSVVEDVAGTLAWIQEHGTYVATTDTTVQAGTIYFELTGGQYVPITNPDPSANPQSQGWYVLDITDSQSQYIMAHLAVTSAGLWVLPSGSFSSHNIEDSSGNTLVDSQGNVVISWQTDPQNADGYKVLLSNSGMVVFNNFGEAVAVYGAETTIGSGTGKNVHIDSDSVDIRNGSTVLSSFSASLVELGKNSTGSTIEMCGGKGEISYDPSINGGSLEIRNTGGSGDVELTAGDGETFASVGVSESDASMFAEWLILRGDWLWLGDFEENVSNNYEMPDIISAFDKSIPQGTIVTQAPEAVSVASGTHTTLGSITLAAGVWIVTVSTTFAASNTGRRAVYFTTSSSEQTIRVNESASLTMAPADGGTSKYDSVAIVNPSSSTTYYCRVWQNSGSSLSCQCWLRAVRIA